MQKLLMHIAVILCLACTPLAAKLQVTATYSITGTDNSPHIFALKMHSRGYMLVGAADGLYRFDGHGFSAYSFAGNIQSKAISAIAEDKDGMVWLGFQNGTIGVLEKNIISVVSHKIKIKDAITSIIADSSGTVYFATAGSGIYYYQRHRFYNINMTDGISDNYVYQLVIHNHQLVAGTDRGVNFIELNNKKVISALTAANGLPDNIVRCLYFSENENAWIGMQDKGIGYYSGFIKKNNVLTYPGTWKYGQVNSLLRSGNQLLIATEDSGVITSRLTGSDFSKTGAFSSFKNSNFKTSNLLQDNEGNVWFTSKEKLVRANGANVQTIIPFTEKMYAEAHCILADNAGNYWVNTTNSLKKFFYNQPLQAWQSKTFLTSVINETTDITCLYQDIYSNIWVGTLGHGIYIIDPATGKERHLEEDSIVKYKNVLSIKGKGTEIWITNLSGVIHCNLNSENRNISNPYQFIKFKKLGNTGSSYIYSTFIDSKDRVWFATDGHGLLMYDKGYFKNYNQADGIKSPVIYNICEDLNSNIWFSALNDGLYKYDGKQFINISIAQGLNDATITSLAADTDNNIIAITKKGINVVNASSLCITYIDNDQQVMKINTDLNCLSTTGNHLFMIGGQGILQYMPAGQNIGPAILLDAVKIYGSSADISLPGKFSYDENNFTFYYTGISFSHADELIYQYKIEDGALTTKWITTKDNSINIPKLPPGKYIFRVRSSVNNYFDGSREANYSFTINKPLWLQWWFIIIVSAAFGSLLYVYIKNRESRLKRWERLQKEKVQSQLETLKSQVNPHFLFNSFNTLISVIENDQQLAVEYVEHLSDFYRRIVMYRDKDVIMLKEELDVLANYLFIQKKRFGQNLLFTCHLTYEEQSRNYISPMTLQLLAENAIKHNAISADTPLHIQIDIRQECLVISNNMTPKINTESSAGMGLQNIKNRYRLLSNVIVTVDCSQNNFIVRIPLLKSFAL